MTTGGAGTSPEASAGSASLAMVFTLLRRAARSLWRSRGFSLVAILTLGLGIGLSVAIFSVVYGVLLRPLDTPGADRVVTVWQSPVDGAATGEDGEPTLELTSRGLFRAWRQGNRSFTAMGGYILFPADLAGDGDALPESVASAAVTRGYFETFGVTPALGRGFETAEETQGQHFAAVLSHDLWQRRFAGDDEILGRPIRLNEADYTVVGVLPESFREPLNPEVEVWTPLPLDPPPEDHAHSYVYAVGRLAEGVSASAARQDLAAVTAAERERHPEALAGVGITLQPVLESVVGSSERLLLLLLGAVLLVLLATCANVGSLVMTRIANRGPEIALRSALGAGRGRLSALVLAEGLVLGLVSAGVGLAVGWAGVWLLRAQAPSQVPRVEAIQLDGPVFAFALSVALFAGLLAAFLPAVRIWRRQPAEVLRQGAGVGGARAANRLRAGLVVAEIAIGLVLLMGAGVLLRTMLNLHRVDPGFAVEGVVLGQVNLSPARFAEADDLAAFAARVEEELNQRPEIDAGGVVSVVPPASGHAEQELEVEGRRDRGAPVSALLRGISPGFLEALEIPVTEGRAIDSRDVFGATPVALVNQRFVERYSQGRSPLGRQLRLAGEEGDPWRTIVGVTGDIHGLALDRPPVPEVYLPTYQWPSRSLAVVGRMSVPPETGFLVLRQVVDKIQPGLVVAGVDTLEERLSRSLALRNFLALLIAGFALVALLLVGIGTYGVISLAVVQRRLEIAVRLAVGAQRRSVVGMVLLWTVVLTAIGVGLGLALSSALGRTVANFLFGVEPFDPPTALAVALLIAGIAFLASLVPALRAARTDPMEALKTT